MTNGELPTTEGSANSMGEIPREQGILHVGDGQRIYREDGGSPDGLPALYLARRARRHARGERVPSSVRSEQDPRHRLRATGVRAIHPARLTTHHRTHLGLHESPLNTGREKIRHIPGTLFHRRRDVSGPVITAWKLHPRWPGSALVIDEGDAHGASAWSNTGTAPTRNWFLG